MTNRELKKLKRADLLEMLIVKSQENESLKRALEDANQKLEEANRQLAQQSAADGVSERHVSALMKALKVAAAQYLEDVRPAEDMFHEKEED